MNLAVRPELVGQLDCIAVRELLRGMVFDRAAERGLVGGIGLVGVGLIGRV